MAIRRWPLIDIEERRQSRRPSTPGMPAAAHLRGRLDRPPRGSVARARQLAGQHRALALLPKPEVERGHDEEIEPRRSEQSTQDYDRHWVLDLMTGDAPGRHQRHQRQTR